MRDKLLRYFLSWLYWFPIIRHNIACRKSLLKPLYKKRCEDGLSCNEGDRKIIYMVLPETTFSGGLSDRLRAIVAIYKQCNTKNLPFRIVRCTFRTTWFQTNMTGGYHQRIYVSTLTKFIHALSLHITQAHETDTSSLYKTPYSVTI